jgi:hypothetical protein
MAEEDYIEELEEESLAAGGPWNPDMGRMRMGAQVTWIRAVDRVGFHFPVPKREPTGVFGTEKGREIVFTPDRVLYVVESWRLEARDEFTNEPIPGQLREDQSECLDRARFVCPTWFFTLMFVRGNSANEICMVSWDSTIEVGRDSQEVRHHKIGVNMGSIVPALGYLDSTAEHFVTVKPVSRTQSEKVAKKAAKTTRLFPWLDEEAPRIVLLDPVRHYPVHGREAVGTHVSPIPHQRKGHYMLLQAERYINMRGQKVFRRPAWIGDREWIHHGSVYRTLDKDPREESDNGDK